MNDTPGSTRTSPYSSEIHVLSEQFANYIRAKDLEDYHDKSWRQYAYHNDQQHKILFWSAGLVFAIASASAFFGVDPAQKVFFANLQVFTICFLTTAMWCFFLRSRLSRHIYKGLAIRSEQHLNTYRRSDVGLLGLPSVLDLDAHLFEQKDYPVIGKKDGLTVFGGALLVVFTVVFCLVGPDPAKLTGLSSMTMGTMIAQMFELTRLVPVAGLTLGAIVATVFYRAKINQADIRLDRIFTNSGSKEPYGPKRRSEDANVVTMQNSDDRSVQNQVCAPGKNR